MKRSARPKTHDVAAGVFAGTSLSQGWLATVAGVDAASQQKLFHTLTRVACPLEETDDIRAAAERLLVAKRMPSIETVANTIFPAAMAASCGSHTELVDRYRLAYPTLRRFPGNAAGTYFGRMVAHPGGSAGGPFDQLGKIINRLTQQLALTGPMSTPYQMTTEAQESVGRDGDDGMDSAPAAPVYTPSDNLIRGFPCMSFVHFQTDGHVLHAYAHYRYEYLIEKGYGNYLGLARLQGYVATHVGLDVGALTISAGRAQVDASSAQVQLLPHASPLFD